MVWNIQHFCGSVLDRILHAGCFRCATFGKPERKRRVAFDKVLSFALSG
jgi:hypothetical protein